MSRDDASLLDIVIAARRIVSFTRGRTLDHLVDDDVVLSAVLYQFVVVGEAATRLSDATRTTHASIPWRAVVGMRNVAVHQYDNLDLTLIWDAVQRTVPSLLAQLEPLIAEPGEGNNG